MFALCSGRVRFATPNLRQRMRRVATDRGPSRGKGCRAAFALLKACADKWRNVQRDVRQGIRWKSICNFTRRTVWSVTVIHPEHCFQSVPGVFAPLPPVPLDRRPASAKLGPRSPALDWKGAGRSPLQMRQRPLCRSGKFVGSF